MKISKEQKSDLLSLIIGDGFITKGDRLELCHGEKQLDYLQWKFNTIKTKLNLETNPKISLNIKTLNNKQYKNYSVGFSLKKRFGLGGIRKEIYDGKTKNYANILNQIIDLNFFLAIWIGDDGSIGRRQTNGVVNSAHIDIFTCDQNYESHLKIQKWFIDNIKVTPTIKIMKSKKQNTEWYYLSFKQEASMILWNKIRFLLLNCDSMKHKFRHIEEKFKRSFSHLEYNPSERQQQPLIG